MATSEKTKEILNKSYKDLPVAKDLPRLAKRISLKDAEGNTILQPSNEMSVPEYLYSLIFTLSTLLEIEEEKEKSMDKGWKLCWEEKAEHERIMEKFLEVYMGEESKLLKVLKACNQAVIATAIIELKMALGPANATKDVPDSWYLSITVQPNQVIVENRKREQSLMAIFQFEWVLRIFFDKQTYSCKEVTLKVVDLNFMCSTPEKMEEVRAILNKYTEENRTEKETIEEQLEGSLPGEKVVLKEEKARTVFDDKKSFSGTLWITTYRLLFIPNIQSTPRQQGIRYPLEQAAAYSEISLTTIHKMKRHSVFPNTIEIWCKDLRLVLFSFDEGQERADQFLNTSLKTIPAHLHDSFAFKFCPKSKEVDATDGWDVYDVSDELKRLKLPNEKWKFCILNHTYKLCDSYPHLLAVPKELLEENLYRICGVRVDARFPTLAWKHPSSLATLCHGAPPEYTSTDPCLEDVKLIEDIIKTNPNAAFYIVDTESSQDSKNNTLPTDPSLQVFYEKLKIDSIISLKDSFKKLSELCSSHNHQDRDWQKDLDGTSWFYHIQSLLNGAVRIVELLDQGSSVLIQCKDHYDRTPQLTSIALLLMDPYYRTIIGFELLIEKEWKSFGHKFRDRCGFLSLKPQQAPIFLQFIDCVWQLTHQFPNDFEFNSKFLVTVMHHLYSGLYGTFLTNSIAECKKYNLPASTISLWSHVHKTILEFKNGNFLPRCGLLIPSTSMKRLQFWSDYYLRWVTDAQVIFAPLLENGDDRRSNKSNSGLEEDRQSDKAGRNNKTKDYVNRNDLIRMNLETVRKENLALQKQNKKLLEKYHKLKRKYSTQAQANSGKVSKAKGGKKSDPTASAFPGIPVHLADSVGSGKQIRNSKSIDTPQALRKEDSSVAFPGIQMHTVEDGVPQRPGPPQKKDPPQLSVQGPGVNRPK